MRIVGEPSRVFDETADNRSLGVFANYGYNVLIGSDVKNWTTYEQSTFSDLRLPVANFQQFCMLARRDTVIINTLLNKKKSYALFASLHKSVTIPITIYEDINVLFGQKGTGKSEILRSLYNQMVSLGINCRRYTGSEKDEDFSSLLKTKDMEPEVAKVVASECTIEFNQIFEWTDTNPTLFVNYVNWYSTKDNNVNKSKIKITDSSELVEPEPTRYQTYLSDRKHIKEIQKELRNIDYSLYLSEENSRVLQNLLCQLDSANQDRLVNDLIQIEAVKLGLV